MHDLETLKRLNDEAQEKHDENRRRILERFLSEGAVFEDLQLGNRKVADDDSKGS